jgi:hypothetical protein
VISKLNSTMFSSFLEQLALSGNSVPPNIRAILRSEWLPQTGHLSNRLLLTDSQSTHKTAICRGRPPHLFGSRRRETYEPAQL